MVRAWTITGAMIWGLMTAASAGAAPTSTGTDFWLGLPATAAPAPMTTPQFVLNLTSTTAASGTVSVPGTAFSQPFTVTPGAATSVPVPLSVQSSTDDAVETGHAVHVSSDHDVTVDALYQSTGLSDGYLGLPTSFLGTSYDVAAAPGTSLCGSSEFELIGTQSDTAVTITPVTAIGSHAAGTPYIEHLDAGSTYLGQGTGTADVSATQISADKPVAVLSGSGCGEVPAGQNFANALIEEGPPIATWGTEFFTMPFAGRTGGDDYLIINDQANTTISLNGMLLTSIGVAHAATTHLISGPAHITADKPILLVHLAQGGSLDNSGDPTMVVVPPTASYTRIQTVTTPATGFANNGLNISIATADIATLTLDGRPVSASAFSPIGDSTTESGAQLTVSGGQHTLVDAGPFGAEAYGFDPASADAYGFPAAFGDPARAPAPTITIATPAAGAQYAAGQTVVSAYSCSAAFGTTISSCAGPVPSGSAIDTTPGTHTFTVTAADGYGGHSTQGVTYTVAPPGNHFTLKLGRPDRKTGNETVTVTVPGSGTLRGVETATVPTSARHKKKSNRLTVARAQRTVPAAGRFELKFKPSRKAKSILRKRHRLRVVITITFTPTGGTAGTATAHTTLRLSRRS